MSSLAWSPADIADAVARGLELQAGALDEERAVHGLDVLDEVRLHPHIADALAAAGFGVHREERYPADRVRRRRSEGERCDFVLTPGGLDLRADDRPPTLFDAPDAVALDDAYWLEVKVVAQFTPEGPNPRYGPQLLSTVRGDVTKLSKDRGILHAGFLMVLFVADPEVALNDMAHWESRCLKLGLPIGAPSRRSLPINNRVGHDHAVLHVYPVMGL